jgi:hypothetical protein
LSAGAVGSSTTISVSGAAISEHCPDSTASQAAGVLSLPSSRREEGYSLLQHEGMGEGSDRLTPTLSPHGKRKRTESAARSCTQHLMRRG